MAAAARITDTTTHGGTVIGPGVSTVFIAGKPAAVLGDTHSCPIPIITGHLPSSPFTMGSSTVTIGGKPALRSGDVCGCGASVAVGEISVLIG